MPNRTKMKKAYIPHREGFLTTPMHQQGNNQSIEQEKETKEQQGCMIISFEHKLHHSLLDSLKHCRQKGKKDQTNKQSLRKFDQFKTIIKISMLIHMNFPSLCPSPKFRYFFSYLLLNVYTADIKAINNRNSLLFLIKTTIN